MAEGISGTNLTSDGADTTEKAPDSNPIPNPYHEHEGLSKNQIKKLKKREKWLQIKSEKRQAERLKKKRRFAELKKSGAELGPSRKSLKKKRMVDSACHLRVAIDCSFDELMSEKDNAFLVQQIQHSYAANRRADNPIQMYVCAIAGKAKERLDNIGDYKGWDFHKEERHYAEVFPKEEIVYLSSESPNVLDTLDDTKVYVIGGLVDHNHHKGLCHKLAEEKGVSHAQLPIGQFLQLKSRKVLTINHVFEVLLRFTQTSDWQASFLSVLPQRKGLSVKEDKEKEDAGSPKILDDKCQDSKDGSETDAGCETIPADSPVDSAAAYSVTDSKSTEGVDAEDVKSGQPNDIVA